MKDFKQAIDPDALKWGEVAALGDVVVVLRRRGGEGIGFVRGIEAPMRWNMNMDREGALRQVSVHVGWRSSEWRELSAEDRAAVGSGAELWQMLKHYREARA